MPLPYNNWLLLFRISGGALLLTLVAAQFAIGTAWASVWWWASGVCLALCLLGAWRMKDSHRTEAAVDANLLRDDADDVD